MAELFEVIGFQVADDASFNKIIEWTEVNGEHSHAHRAGAVLHGRCWKLGGGLEVWSILYDDTTGLYYADCRPGFRSRYIQLIHPWELIEYDEDGEAVVRGEVPGGASVMFELQNLTELSPVSFREPELRVALAGLAYHLQAHSFSGGGADAPFRFELAETLPEYHEAAYETDYLISGRVLAWREVENPVTGTRLVWVYVNAGRIQIEILANRKALQGKLKIGSWVSAHVWLQGYVLEESEVSARYEGVDREYEQGDFWARLRRSN